MFNLKKLLYFLVLVSKVLFFNVGASDFVRDLMEAVRNEQAYKVSQLLKTQLDSAIIGQALTEVVRFQRQGIGMVNLLLEHDPEDKYLNEALRIAQSRGNSCIIKRLIEEGAEDDYGIKTQLDVEVETGDKDKVAKFISDHNPGKDELDRALRVAVKNQYKDIVKLLLEKGANPNDENWIFRDAPLFVAVKRNNKDIVNLLLKYNADPNVYEGVPLQIAVKKGYKDIVNLLLKYNADPNIYPPDSGLSSLDIAAYEDNKDIVKLLLEYNANIISNLNLIGNEVIKNFFITSAALDAIIGGTASTKQTERIEKIMSRSQDQDLVEIIEKRLLHISPSLLREYLSQQNYDSDIYRMIVKALIVGKYTLLLKNEDFSSLPIELQLKILIESYELPEAFLDLIIKTASGKEETFGNILRDHIEKQSSHK